MIVKSLEEVSTESQSLFINMIRIYQEREINTEDQKSKSLNKIGANGSIEGQIQHKDTNSFVKQGTQVEKKHKNKKIQKAKTDASGTKKQYTLIKEIVASDSGPISLSIEDAEDGEEQDDNDAAVDEKVPNFQTTSTMFHGRNMYFYKDVIEEPEVLDE